MIDLPDKLGKFMKEGKLSVGQISNFFPRRCVRLGIFWLLILSFPGKNVLDRGHFSGATLESFHRGETGSSFVQHHPSELDLKDFQKVLLGRFSKKIWKVSTVERQAPPLSAFSYTILQNWISKISRKFSWEYFLKRFLESFYRPADFSPSLKHILKAGDAGDMSHANFWGFSSFPLDKIN